MVHFCVIFSALSLSFTKYALLLLSSKVIQGNTNFYSIKTRDLNPKVIARYLRINPQYWKGWPCLRTDFMGCSKDEGNKTLQADINLYVADSQDNWNESKASRSSERSKRKRKEIKNSKLVNKIKSFSRCQCFIVIFFFSKSNRTDTSEVLLLRPLPHSEKQGLHTRWQRSLRTCIRWSLLRKSFSIYPWSRRGVAPHLQWENGLSWKWRYT